jgi:hypothetical protein
MVTDIVIEVIASFSTNVPVPNDAGLGAPVDVVGVVGGFSAAFVMFAVRIVAACPLTHTLSIDNMPNVVLVDRNIIVLPVRRLAIRNLGSRARVLPVCLRSI